MELNALRFTLHALRFTLDALRLRVEDLGFADYGLRITDLSLWLKVQGGVEGSGFKVQGLEFRVKGSG